MTKYPVCDTSTEHIGERTHAGGYNDDPWSTARALLLRLPLRIITCFFCHLAAPCTLATTQNTQRFTDLQFQNLIMTSIIPGSTFCTWSPMKVKARCTSDFPETLMLAFDSRREGRLRDAYSCFVAAWAVQLGGRNEPVVLHSRSDCARCVIPLAAEISCWVCNPYVDIITSLRIYSPA